MKIYETLCVYRLRPYRGKGSFQSFSGRINKVFFSIILRSTVLYTSLNPLQSPTEVHMELLSFASSLGFQQVAQLSSRG
jgi:hypothetical protein